MNIQEQLNQAIELTPGCKPTTLRSRGRAYYASGNYDHASFQTLPKH